MAASAATVVVATAMIVAAMLVAATATTAATRRMKLFFRSVAHKQDATLEMDRLAGKRMVEIHCHINAGHFLHQSRHRHSLCRHHRDRRAFINVLVVKLAVHFEKFARKFHHMFVATRAKSLLPAST